MIGQSLILIINAWNKKIHAKFEHLKERKSGKSGLDSVEDKITMDESFEEISTEVFENINRSPSEGINKIEKIGNTRIPITSSDQVPLCYAGLL